MPEGTNQRITFRPVLYSCQDLGKDFGTAEQRGAGYLTTIGISVANAKRMVYCWAQGNARGGTRGFSLFKQPEVLGIEVELDIVSNPKLVDDQTRKYYLSDWIDMESISSWIREKISAIGEVDVDGLYLGLTEWFNVWDDE